jgi:hypothetical protein
MRGNAVAGVFVVFLLNLSATTVAFGEDQKYAQAEPAPPGTAPATSPTPSAATAQAPPESKPSSISQAMPEPRPSEKKKQRASAKKNKEDLNVMKKM